MRSAGKTSPNNQPIILYLDLRFTNDLELVRHSLSHAPRPRTAVSLATRSLDLKKKSAGPSSEVAAGRTHGAGTGRRAGGGACRQLAVMSRQAKDDFLRHYTVSDPRTHPKGYTEYKVTAQVRWDSAGDLALLSSPDPCGALKAKSCREVAVWPAKMGFPFKSSLRQET